MFLLGSPILQDHLLRTLVTARLVATRRLAPRRHRMASGDAREDPGHVDIRAGRDRAIEEELLEHVLLGVAAAKAEAARAGGAGISQTRIRSVAPAPQRSDRSRSAPRPPAP